MDCKTGSLVALAEWVLNITIDKKGEPIKAVGRGEASSVEAITRQVCVITHVMIYKSLILVSYFQPAVICISTLHPIS